MRRAAGFTLIELVAIIVVLSVGALGLAKLHGNAAQGLATATNVQIMSQHAQACIERVIATRRDLGFNSASLTSTMCNPAPAGYTRVLTLPATYTGTATTTCPNGATCRNVTVMVCADTSPDCSGNVMKSSVVQLLVLY